MHVLQGSQVTFNCEATGDSDIIYLWQRVDDTLDLDRTTGIHSSELTISNVLPNDNGKYVCIASNKKVKIESRIAILHVQGLCSLSYIVIIKTIFCCVANCPIDITIYNGNVKYGGDGVSLTYQCANGFRLIGATSATCKEDGTWSSPPPKCTGIIYYKYNIVA